MGNLETPFSLSEISESYDALFKTGSLRESDGFYRWVLNRLNPAPGLTLLDISCGEGHLLKWASQLKNLIPFGIDLSPVALEFTRYNIAKAQLGRCDAVALPFPDNAFHYITNLGSLEHYMNIPLGIREMVRVLHPGGKIAVFVPNSYYLADIIWHVWRTGYGPSHRQVQERFATAGEWGELLAEGGIQILRTCAYNFRFPTTRDDWRWYLKRPRKFLYLLLAPFVPFNLAYHFLFVGQKAL